MLGYVYGHDVEVARFVARLIPHFHGREFDEHARALGIIDGEGKLIAGVVYHNYDPEAALIEISGAALPGKYWITPETLRRAYQYPFLGLRCQMVVQRTPSDNEYLLEILAKLNYAFIRFPRMMGRDRDGTICYLTYEAWCDGKICRRYKHHIADQRLAEAAE